MNSNCIYSPQYSIKRGQLFLSTSHLSGDFLLIGWDYEGEMVGESYLSGVQDYHEGDLLDSPRPLDLRLAVTVNSMV